MDEYDEHTFPPRCLFLSLHCLKFEEYERAWESDSEEEAFVDSLALKLMEDAAGVPPDLDDEDPDTDDWGDMYSDNDDERNVQVDPDSYTESDSDIDEETDNVKKGDAHDEDDFMDDDESNDSDDAEHDEDSSIDEDAALGQKGLADEDSELENDLIFANDDDDSDEEQGDEEIEEKSRSRKKAKKADSLPTFASADDYAELINKDFEELVMKKEEPSPSARKKKKSKK